MIVVMSPLRSKSTFYYLSLTIQLEKNICQVTNYNFIKTIKSEPTFGKSQKPIQSPFVPIKPRQELDRHQVGTLTLECTRRNQSTDNLKKNSNWVVGE